MYIPEYPWNCSATLQLWSNWPLHRPDGGTQTSTIHRRHYRIHYNHSRSAAVPIIRCPRMLLMLEVTKAASLLVTWSAAKFLSCRRRLWIDSQLGRRCLSSIANHLIQCFSNLYISKSPLNCDSIWFHLYAVTVNRPLWVNSDPSRGTHRAPGIHFENHCYRRCCDVISFPFPG